MLAFISSIGLAVAVAVIARYFYIFTEPTISRGDQQPRVQLDQGTFVGTRNENIDKFLGIPYAKPPVGDLRFRLPVANEPYKGTHNASTFGSSCLQQAISFSSPANLAPEAIELLKSFSVPLPKSDEDCLTLNIWKPSEVPEGTRLPVVVWIHGGGFEVGSAASTDGSVIVKRSLEMDNPIMYISINYRLSAFGFLAGTEVKNAGVANLGLQDQREALRWVQRYISAFNGDPSKVTIWGQSAGAWSVGLQMVANAGDNEGLFRGAFMHSGSPVPYGDISHGQKYYDELVVEAGCANASDSLQCLRGVSSSVIKTMMDATPSLLSKEALSIVWMPRSDGTFFVDPPFQAVLKGAVANVPFVSGECDDEGTLFMLAQSDIITDNEVQEFVSSNYFPNASADEMNRLLTMYPQDLSQGSPFATGNRNALTPQSKRLAALQGDLLYTAPRRFLLQQRSEKQPAWSFSSRRMKSFPDLGSFHAHDMANVYGPGDLTDYLVNFVNYLDPNGPDSADWPQYTPSGRVLMTFLDGPAPRKLERDDFREDSIGYVTSLLLKYAL
ncbi:carotenoid ester lipase precursor [Irpex rosettiformis]|uniref:Carotenoid ester lipase n=1 Tax=Irpex rosettiformis TaxID=378272 RepID=A0ACB8UBY3_9APHY|nr:carotenoid ester lipase precursor [Irpex rosettiformis]